MVVKDKKKLIECKENEKILVTGGTGYLGARIGKFLAECGYEVNLGSRHPFSRGAVEGCDQILTDWDDPKLAFCKGYDFIIHAAGMNARECEKNSQLAAEFNGQTTQRLVEAAASYGCKNFFYLSTVHVYKSPLLGNFNEKSTCRNNHPYATSHLLGEQALHRVTKGSPMTGHVLRLSNCFGYPLTKTNECWSLVLNEFVRDAFRLGKITIKENCFSKRDFLPISELNNIFAKILNIDTLIPNTINICTGTSRSLIEVAEQVRAVVTELTGKPVNILTEPVLENNYELNIESKSLFQMGIQPKNTLSGEIKLLLASLNGQE